MPGPRLTLVLSRRALSRPAANVTFGPSPHHGADLIGNPLQSAVMAGKDAGVPVTCAGCGETVLQKTMIPILGEGGKGISYLCPPCARKLVDAAPKDVARMEGEAGEPGT